MVLVTKVLIFQISQYEEMCHYAHGTNELREENKELSEQHKIKKNPFYKTIMCKSLATCQYGSNCIYAHSEDEIRPMAANLEQGAQMTSGKYRNQFQCHPQKFQYVSCPSFRSGLQNAWWLQNSFM